MGTNSGQSQDVRFHGDLSPRQRLSILMLADFIVRGRGEFAKSTGSRIEVKEVSVYQREEDDKTQVRMIFELDVEDNMLNSGSKMHGGCSMFLIDVCSSIAIMSLGLVTQGQTHLVSQAITTVFHAPATTGARLRIVNTTVSFGARTVTARTEIWDTTNRRLVASGVHSQMRPSVPKL